MNRLNLGEVRQTARGRFKAQVVCARTGKVLRSTPWQDNLILDAGLDLVAASSWAAQLAYCVAGTGNTPTKDLPDGTYSQATTTVTRATGTRDFISGDVGKLIRWATGQEAKITAFLGTTTVTVSDSKTVAAGALDAIYRVGQIGLATETKRTNTQPEFIDDDDSLTAKATTFDAAAATVTMKVTRDFTEEVGNVNYTEIGMSAASGSGNNLFSRMLLAGAVTVQADQLLRVKYELTIKTMGGLLADQVTVDGGITGWPLPYNIVSITSTGANFTVTLDDTHHYLAGGKININGAKRPRHTITVAASTVSDFTITAVAHGFTNGQSVIIEGVTPSGYNGTFTIDSHTTDTFTVLSVLNPGTGTVFGNVRQAEPGTWYDGEWTIASVTTTTVVVTSAINPPSAGQDGTAYNNVKRKFVAVGNGVSVLNTSGYGATDAAVARALGGAGGDSSAASFLNLGMLDGHSQDMWILIPATAPTVLPNDFPQYWGIIVAGPGFACQSTAGVTQSPAVTNVFAAGVVKAAAQSSYTNGNFYRETSLVLSASDANYTDIKFVGIGIRQSPFIPSIQGYILFEQPQRKRNTYKLTLTLRRSWGRDLDTIPF